MKYNGPKVRLSRRLGIALTPKAEKVMQKKPYAPGVFGANPKKFRSKDSVYKLQLVEKQKFRFQYNIHEKQMRAYYHKATTQKGNTVDNLIRQMESRLDAVVLRAGFARTIYAARQYVGHGHIEVNGKRVNIASYQVKPGDVVTVREKSRKIEQIAESVQNEANVIPPYIEVDAANFSATYKYAPLRNEVPVQGEVPLVIEFYSR